MLAIYRSDRVGRWAGHCLSTYITPDFWSKISLLGRQVNLPPGLAGHLTYLLIYPHRTVSRPFLEAAAPTESSVLQLRMLVVWEFGGSGSVNTLFDGSFLGVKCSSVWTSFDVQYKRFTCLKWIFMKTSFNKFCYLLIVTSYYQMYLHYPFMEYFGHILSILQPLDGAHGLKWMILHITFLLHW